MKKITLLLLCLISLANFAQTTLTQNTSMAVTAGSITCNGSGIPAENTFYRYFDLNALGYSQFTVNRIDFAVESYTAGTGSYFVDVQVFSNAGGVFPAGTLTLLGSQSVEVLSSHVGTVVPVTLSTPVVVGASQMIIALKVNNAQTASGGNGATFFPGSNGSGQSGLTYVTASSCGINTPTSLTSIGFPNMHIVLTATGVAVLGNEDFNQGKMVLYPNPVKDVLNIQLSNNDNFQFVEILDIDGRIVVSSDQYTINVSQLQSGIYFVKMKLGNNVFTQKFIKD